MPKISIDFISEKLRDELFSLKNGKYHERQLYIFINRAFDDIETDINCSIKVPKKLWPKEYKKYKVTNLWKYDLPNGWRLLFTLKQEGLSLLHWCLFGSHIRNTKECSDIEKGFDTTFLKAVFLFLGYMGP